MVNGNRKIPKIPVMELFGPTIQGEGLMTGTLSHFLRTGGCGLHCTWCDSLFAVEPKLIKQYRTMMTVQQILETVDEMPYAPYMTFTGGDPCIQPHLGSLIEPLNYRSIAVAVETQGQMFPDWLNTCDVITFSPKGPSSGNIVDPTDLSKWLEDNTYSEGRRKNRICIKVVVFNREDFEYAMELYDSMHMNTYDAFYFTAGTDLSIEEPTHKALSVLQQQRNVTSMLLQQATIQAFNPKVHIGCQNHVLLWPDKDKGV